MANAAGAPRICSLRTIKSDVVVGLGDEGDEIAERMDKEEPGWKISGKYVSPGPCRPPQRRLLIKSQAVVSFSEGRPGEKVRFA